MNVNSTTSEHQEEEGRRAQTNDESTQCHTKQEGKSKAEPIKKGNTNLRQKTKGTAMCLLACLLS